MHFGANVFENVFLDLDGTVYLGSQTIDNVEGEIQRLSNAGVVFHYLTNNTSLSTHDYVRKLAKLHLPVCEQRVITPIKPIVSFLRRRSAQARVAIIGTVAFVEEVASAGHCTLDFERPDILIVGFDRELTYAKLELACGLINAGVPYYLTNIDLACPTAMGPIPDCGAIGKVLELATGIAPVDHFGKPGDALVEYIRASVDCATSLLVAGDRLYTDGTLGLRLAGTTLLVRSGEFNGAAEDVPRGITVADTLASYLRELH
jgi:HAD superfamily hydrolase (TIGR01450 family)